MLFKFYLIEKKDSVYSVANTTAVKKSLTIEPEKDILYQYLF